jgi:hypothetical protein
MNDFAKVNQNLSYMIWKHYVPKKGDVNSRIDTENYESWVETLQRIFFGVDRLNTHYLPMRSSVMSYVSDN